jgi:hypothetical protein
MSDLSERADALEMRMARELQEKIAPISVRFERDDTVSDAQGSGCPGVRDSSCSGTG